MLPLSSISVVQAFLYFRRQIDYTGWFLVFTRKGRYFFYDSVDECSHWSPPDHLLEYLLDLSAEKLALLFNPFEEYIVEQPQYANDYHDMEGQSQDEYEYEDDYDYGYEAETETKSLHEEDSGQPRSSEQSTSVRFEGTPRVKNVRPLKHIEEHQVAIENFKQMLIEKKDLDPFQSWEKLAALFHLDPRFQAIKTEKEQRSIFDSICPQLAEIARRLRESKQALAIESWKERLDKLTLALAPGTWTEFSKQLKKEPWFRHLNPKTMEKEYRNRVSELRTRSLVYQIPQ